MTNLLKIDEYCSAEVADMSCNVKSLPTTHSNNPLHEYPEKQLTQYTFIFRTSNILIFTNKFAINSRWQNISPQTT